MPSTKTSTSIDRRAHPLAAHLWGDLRDRSEADRQLVYEVLRARLGVPELPAKQEQAAEALRRFVACQEAVKNETVSVEDLPSWASGTPSRRRYDDFRSLQEDPDEWPSSEFIRNAFDRNWNAALVAIGQRPAVDVSSRRLTARGKPYTREEVLKALRLWVSEVDADHGADEPLRQQEYRLWAEEQRRSPDPPLPRFPTIPVIREQVGRWPEVLVALGHSDRSAAPGVAVTSPESLSDEPAKDFDLESAPAEAARDEWHLRPGSSQADTRAKALIAWLSWVAEQLPESKRRTLTCKEFNRYVASVRRLSLVQGHPLQPPSGRAIADCLEIGGWNRAKQKAGLLEAELPIRKRSTRPFSDQQLIEALLDAMQDLGPEITRSEYSTWRDQQLSESNEGDRSRGSGSGGPGNDSGSVGGEGDAGDSGNGNSGGRDSLSGSNSGHRNRSRRIPSEASLRQRFAEGGAWSKAVSRALQRASEVALYIEPFPEGPPEPVRPVPAGPQGEARNAVKEAA